jgi:3-deoxy-7-phosphoheptulonate synthase
MHGNTFSHGSYKVRSFDEIKSEARNFFEICRSEGAIPGGIHLEISSENVSECIGGVTGLDVSRLGENYRSKVDPRLNAAQSIEFAFFLAELIERDNDIRRAA